MEYIELDIKQIIHEFLREKIVPNSIDFKYELQNSTLNRVYGSNVYYSDEVDGIIEVFVDFACNVIDNQNENQSGALEVKGSFSGRFNLNQKHFIDEGFCNIYLH